MVTTTSPNKGKHYADKLYEAEKYVEAEIEYKRLVNESTNAEEKFEGGLGIGKCRFRLKDYSEAEKEFEKVFGIKGLEDYKGRFYAKNCLAYLYAVTNRTKNAMNKIDDAIEELRKAKVSGKLDFDNDKEDYRRGATTFHTKGLIEIQSGNFENASAGLNYAIPYNIVLPTVNTILENNYQTPKCAIIPIPKNWELADMQYCSPSAGIGGNVISPLQVSGQEQVIDPADLTNSTTFTNSNSTTLKNEPKNGNPLCGVASIFKIQC